MVRVGLVLAVFGLGCTHDWDRYEPGEAGGGGNSATQGVGGAATLGACQEVCKAERECANLQEAPTCLEDCAAKTADCGAADIVEVRDCGEDNQVVCNSFVFTQCTPGCY